MLLFLTVWILTRLPWLLAVTLTYKFVFSYIHTHTNVPVKQLVDALYIGTIVIHPLLFYLSLVLLCVKVFRLLNAYTLVSTSLNFLNLFYLSTITLLLGGFWGFQSTIWGYFWVNDAVEVLLLLTIIVILLRLHTYGAKLQTYSSLLSLLLIFNLILIVRLNLLPTRHNFIQQSSTFTILVFIYLAIVFISFNVGGIYIELESRRLNVGLFLSFFLTLLAFKFLWLICIVFFFKTLKPVFFERHLYQHIIIFLFFIVWNIYFTFFFLHYASFSGINSQISFLFDGYFSQFRDYILRGLKSSPLESVLFLVKGDAFRVFNLIANMFCFVTMNNATLLIALIIFFVKMVELGLLHATKTLAEESNYWTYRSLSNAPTAF